jgi:hypothetical protein
MKLDEPLIPAFIDPIINNSAAKSQRLQELYDDMLRQAEHEVEFGKEDSDDEFHLEDAIENLGIKHPVRIWTRISNFFE